MEALELTCSGCGKDKDEMAVLRSGDKILALMCRQCLQEAIAMFDATGPTSKDRSRAN